MANFEYKMDCPVCGYVCRGRTHIATEDELKLHCWKKHPVEYSIVQGYTKDEGEDSE